MSANETINLKLTERGLKWLKVDIANTFGLDKELFGYRIKWVDDNIDILESFQDEAESPQEFMKAVNALRNHQAGREVKHYMYLDCSNQALQLYAVLTNDLDTAKVCNLAGFNGKLADAYQMLADELNNTFGTDLFTRKNCKRSLMTTLYGKQKGGLSIVEDMTIKERERMHVEGISEENLNDAFKEVMYTIAPNAMVAMDRIQALNSEYIGTYNWVMPDGFKVKYDVKSKQEYEGKRTSRGGVDFSFSQECEVYRPTRFNAGMAPNVIHSVDGYIVREMVRRAKHRFITTIHDAYAMHPNDIDFMRETYFDILVEILNSDLLNDIMKQISDKRAFIPNEKSMTLTEGHIRRSLYALS